MTIEITEEQASYLQEYLSERLEENLDLEEAESLHDLYEKLDNALNETDEDVNQFKLFDADEINLGD